MVVKIQFKMEFFKLCAFSLCIFNLNVNDDKKYNLRARGCEFCDIEE